MAKTAFELHQLRCFVAVAEELNFRRAAERLNMTQPPLSRQIKLLEHAIGETLFQRSTREVRLTPAGASLLTSAVEILQRAEHAALMARQAARGEAGDVALGFVPSAGIAFVPRIATEILGTLPAVTFKPTELMSYEIVESLLSGRLDLGLTRSDRHGGEIESTLVVREAYVLAIPAGHPLARAEGVALSDLNDAPFIGYSRDRGGFLNTLHKGIFAEAGILPDTVMEVSQTVTVLALVNSGIGLALVPASSSDIGMANIVYRPVVTPPRFHSRLYLAAGPKQRNSPLYPRMREAVLRILAPYR